MGFMVAAVLAFVRPGPPNETLVMLSIIFTLQGACCFFVGSSLMLPESAAQRQSVREA